MKSLFLKIFLYFWAAQLLIALSLYALSAATQRAGIEEDLRGGSGASLEARAQAAAVAYEYGGQKAVRAAWFYAARRDHRGGGKGGHRGDGPEDRASASLYAAGANPTISRLLAGPPLSEKLAPIVAGAFENGRAAMPLDDGYTWQARRIATASGKVYVAVQRLRPPPDRLGPLSWQGPPDEVLRRFLVIAISLGAVSFALARYLTSPAIKLRHATRQLAAGDLSTRVGAQMGKRRDELADLGRDFDLMAERIETLLTTQRRLLGDISHELRSPLARLQLALELAADSADAPTREYLTRIELEADRLNAMIGQLLTLTRLESRDAPAQSVSFDLAELVSNIALDADFEARGHNRRVQSELPDECSIVGDAGLLGSAIENVVRNAVRYTREETSVEVALQCRNKQALITVRDYGPGVPEESLSELFRPFYRVADARDRESGGVGLGLAIAERAVRLHGGKATASNAPDGGLVVKIGLPMDIAR